MLRTELVAVLLIFFLKLNKMKIFEFFNVAYNIEFEATYAIFFGTQSTVDITNKINIKQSKVVDFIPISLLQKFAKTLQQIFVRSVTDDYFIRKNDCLIPFVVYMRDYYHGI